MAEEAKLPMLGHLRELRKRLMWSAVAVFITTIVSFIFAKDIIEILASRVDDVDFIAIELTENIGTYFKVAFISGIVLATPIILFQIVMFLRPALTPQERGNLYRLLPSILIAFVLGVIFAYFVLIPPAAKFLISFGDDFATPTIRISNYVSVVARLIFAIGLCFELPILMYFLTKIGLVDAHKLSRFRRYNLVLAFLLAAIITPTPDPINQTIVAVPLILLYEVGILLARIAQRGKQEKSAKASAD